MAAALVVTPPRRRASRFHHHHLPSSRSPPNHTQLPRSPSFSPSPSPSPSTSFSPLNTSVHSSPSTKDTTITSMGTALGSNSKSGGGGGMGFKMTRNLSVASIPIMLGLRRPSNETEMVDGLGFGFGLGSESLPEDVSVQGSPESLHCERGQRDDMLLSSPTESELRRASSSTSTTLVTETSSSSGASSLTLANDDLQQNGDADGYWAASSSGDDPNRKPKRLENLDDTASIHSAFSISAYYGNTFTPQVEDVEAFPSIHPSSPCFLSGPPSPELGSGPDLGSASVPASPRSSETAGLLSNERRPRGLVGTAQSSLKNESSMATIKAPDRITRKRACTLASATPTPTATRTRRPNTAQDDTGAGTAKGTARPGLFPKDYSPVVLVSPSRTGTEHGEVERAHDGPSYDHRGELRRPRSFDPASLQLSPRSSSAIMSKPSLPGLLSSSSSSPRPVTPQHQQNSDPSSTITAPLQPPLYLSPPRPATASSSYSSSSSGRAQTSSKSPLPSPSARNFTIPQSVVEVLGGRDRSSYIKFGDEVDVDTLSLSDTTPSTLNSAITAAEGDEPSCRTISLVIDQEGFREILPELHFLRQDPLTSLFEFIPLNGRREAFPFHHSTMQGMPILRRLHIRGDMERDFVRRQARLSLRYNGIWVAEGSEGRSAAGGRLVWRFAYEVRDRLSLMGKNMQGEKNFIPLAFACSPELLDLQHGRKTKFLEVVRKAVAPNLEAIPLEEFNKTQRWPLIDREGEKQLSPERLRLRRRSRASTTTTDSSPFQTALNVEDYASAPTTPLYHTQHPPQSQQQHPYPQVPKAQEDIFHSTGSIFHGQVTGGQHDAAVSLPGPQTLTPSNQNLTAPASITLRPSLDSLSSSSHQPPTFLGRISTSGPPTSSGRARSTSVLICRPPPLPNASDVAGNRNGSNLAVRPSTADPAPGLGHRGVLGMTGVGGELAVVGGGVFAPCGSSGATPKRPRSRGKSSGAASSRPRTPKKA